MTQIVSLLNQFNPSNPLWLDVETTSNDDKKAAFNPYHGDRVCGISLCQQDVAPAYIPLRHRTQLEECFPYEETIRELQQFCGEVKRWGNANIKFDAHFLEQDKIYFPKAAMVDLASLARVHHNYHLEFNLKYLASFYNKLHFKEDEPIDLWLTEHKTKDYGRIPLDIISKYANHDTLAAMECELNILNEMPEESLGVIQEEIKFTRTLFNMEKQGILLNTDYFEIVNAVLAKKLLVLGDRMNIFWSKMNNEDLEFNPNSWQQIARYYEMRKIEPVAWNKQKDGTFKVSWNGDARALIIDEGGMTDDINEYTEASTARSTFAIGWPENACPDSYLRVGFKQHGTETGRSSSSPNSQNPPKWAFKGMRIPEGFIGIKFDYSQIQYRCFAAYACDPGILKAYDDNPKIDYHQLLADRLALSDLRDPIKTVNFMLLFGAGKKKTVKNIAKVLHEAKEKFGIEKYNDTISKLRFKYDAITLDGISNGILEEYHRRCPAIKALIAQVKQALHAKGYIKNFFGRRYYLDTQLAYVGMNYLCQGFEADFVKQRLNAIANDEEFKDSKAKLDNYIHDAAFAIVPINTAQLYLNCINRLSCVLPNFRIPMLIDTEVALYNWGNKYKLKDNDAATTALNILFTKH